MGRSLESELEYDYEEDFEHEHDHRISDSHPVRHSEAGTGTGTATETEDLIPYFDDFHRKLDPLIARKIRKQKKLDKIAFLSGCPRKYYPEHAGNSRFAITFGRFGDPQLPPYTPWKPPDDDRLNKPVSKKGYGMGGLSGPRFGRGFVEEEHESTPGPGYYTVEKGSWTGKQHHFSPKAWFHYGVIKKKGGLKHIKKEENLKKLTDLWGTCQQIKVGFGSNLKLPRFGKEPRYNCVGPGHYEIGDAPAKINVDNGFGRGPIKFSASTKLHCSYGPKDSCVECGLQLMSQMDYYRSKVRIRPIPFTHEAFIKRSSVYTPKPLSEIKRQRVLLCRQCYCDALRGESSYWTKPREVLMLFEKTRHCSYIHAHNGLPTFTEKASCSWTRRLTRKEQTLSRHWPDKCDKRVVDPKHKKKLKADKTESVVSIVKKPTLQ